MFEVHDFHSFPPLKHIKTLKTSESIPFRTAVEPPLATWMASGRSGLLDNVLNGADLSSGATEAAEIGFRRAEQFWRNGKFKRLSAGRNSILILGLRTEKL